MPNPRERNRVHLLRLNDPMLLEHIDQKIGRGVSAALAIDAALDEFETRLGSTNRASIGRECWAKMYPPSKLLQRHAL